MSCTIRQIILGELQANCYIIEGENQHCVVVDPGDESINLVKSIQDLNLTVDAILLTHCHFDHIGAAQSVAKKFLAPIYASQLEAEMMMDPERNLSAYYGLNPIQLPVTEIIEHEQVIDFGNGIRITCLEVPGHTESSMCFYIEDGHVITGDTLFNNSIGRTDLYSGSPEDLARNIKQVLFKLPVETKVHPGHGPSTTIGKELRANQYLR